MLKKISKSVTKIRILVEAMPCWQSYQYALSMSTGSGHRAMSRAKMRRVHLAAATQLIKSLPSNDALVILVTFYRNFPTGVYGRRSA